jgi:hypothetical protein
MCQSGSDPRSLAYKIPTNKLAPDPPPAGSSFKQNALKARVVSQKELGDPAD